MRALGLYSPAVFRRHFELLSRHLANGVRVFRFKNNPTAMRELARRYCDVDGSIARVKEVLGGGRGAVLCPAHACDYLVSLARMREDIPLCIYLRWSKDERKVQLKREWCRAAGLDVIVEQENAADPTSRAAACVEALKNGRLLVITPDIAQKAAKGVPVKMLDKTVYLHSGPASLAMLAEVPLIPLFALDDGGSKTTAYFEEPIEVTTLPRAQGGRKAALANVMQKWTDGFAVSLRRDPALWFMWGDNRWTRALQGDPEYSGTPISEELSEVRPDIGVMQNP